MEYLYIGYRFHGLPIYRTHSTATEEREGEMTSHFTTKYGVLKTSAARHDKMQSAHVKKGYALDLLKHTCQRQTLAGSHFSKPTIIEAGCLFFPSISPLVTAWPLAQPGSHSTRRSNNTAQLPSEGSAEGGGEPVTPGCCTSCTNPCLELEEFNERLL